MEAVLRITTNFEEIDLKFVYQFLTEESHWARGISWEVCHKALQNSLCFAGFLEAQQIAFARVVSDFATFAYLADVFVSPRYRGQGHSKTLLRAVLAHPDLQNLRRFMLATRDAHGLYKPFGFTPLEKPDRFMEIHQADVYVTRDC